MCTSTGHLPVSAVSRQFLLLRIEVYFYARGHYHVAVVPLLGAVNQQAITSWGKNKGRRLSEIIRLLISITTSSKIWVCPKIGNATNLPYSKLFQLGKR